MGLKNMVAALACAATLSACSGGVGMPNRIKLDRPFERADYGKVAEDAQSIIVVGTRVRNKLQSGGVITGIHTAYNLLRIDETTGKPFLPLPGSKPHYILKVDASCNEDVNNWRCHEGVEYDAFLVPEGVYAVTNIKHYGVPLPYVFVEASWMKGWISRSEIHSVHFSPDMTVKPESPRITVRANEVVYAGDLVIDYGRFGSSLLTSQQLSERTVRKVLEGSGLTRRMVVRPWARPVGTGVAAVPYGFGKKTEIDQALLQQSRYSQYGVEGVIMRDD